MGLASSSLCLVSGTLAPPRGVIWSLSVTVVYKYGTFVKHADFNDAFDKEERTWRRIPNTRITITTTTTMSS
jgi:hypothetical protein